MLLLLGFSLTDQPIFCAHHKLSQISQKPPLKYLWRVSRRTF